MPLTSAALLEKSKSVTPNATCNEMRKPLRHQLTLSLGNSWDHKGIGKWKKLQISVIVATFTD